MDRRLARQLRKAAEVGDEGEVQRLLAAGARADANACGWFPLHYAAYFGHEGVVRMLLKAAPASVLAVTGKGWAVLHCAAFKGQVEVMKLVLEAAPAAAAMLNNDKEAPIHFAARRIDAAGVQLLLDEAPAVAFALNIYGETPLHLALLNAGDRPAKQVEDTARCLVRAAPEVQPTLSILAQYSQHSATLFADLVALLPLSQQQWQSIPAPCRDLDRALPAVMERSVAEAGWLVGRLAGGQQARLRMVALCLGRMAALVESTPSLPAQLSQRILVAALAKP